MIIRRQKEFNFRDDARMALTGVDNKRVFRTKAEYDAHMAAEQAKAERAAGYEFPWQEGGSWDDKGDRQKSEKYESPLYNDWKAKRDENRANKTLREENDVPSVVAPGQESSYVDMKKEEAEAEALKTRMEAEAAKKDKMAKGAIIGAGVAAVGAGSYAAYKAWKNKKKAAKKEAEEKFKKD